MPYYSYLNMGIAYDCDLNHFNAIKAYQTSIYLEKQILKGLNCIAACSKEVGLQKLALKFYNECISLCEKGKTEQEHNPAMPYSSRADLWRIIGNEKKMMDDIEKAFSWFKDYPRAWVVKAIFETQKCEFDNALHSLNNAINASDNMLVHSALQGWCWASRGKFYSLIGQLKHALVDFDKACQISSNIDYIYDLGKTFYLNNEYEKAEECYKKYKQRGGEEVNFKESESQFGIVQFIDKKKLFGFISGKSYFNDYDSIYFKISDCNSIINEGDRVKFTIEYTQHKGNFVANAKSIEKNHKINNEDFAKQNIYHAIIHCKQNAFQSSPNLKYIEVFYPVNARLQLSSIENYIPEEVKNDLSKNGHAFVELDLRLNEYFELLLITVKQIDKNNIYRNKSVSQKRYYRRNYFQSSSISSGTSSWHCNICDGDNDTGCQYFDPTECPRK